jgi:energy-converting hydrogenase Eha subunit A
MAFCLAVCTWFAAPAAAQGFDNPELLPDAPTPIIDLAQTLTTSQEKILGDKLAQLEADTGFKLRVLTQFDRTPGRAVKEFWGLDEKSILVIADERGGNLLGFNVGNALYALFPRTFWIELQTRFGNLYYVRDNGPDQSILGVVDTLSTCLHQGGCQVVPGLPREQWILTLVTSVIGGIVLGFAAQPRDGKLVAWQWALIFSPLWGILFIAFGIGPVVSRTSDWLPLFRNVIGFALGALVAYLTPVLGRSPTSES